jgi:2,3-bisphosphoglycerate-dependent phosphoglycerate mutase
MLENKRTSYFAWLAIVGVFVLGFCLWWWVRCGPTTTLLIVRHADRMDSQDALSALGLARAQELVHVAAKAGVVGIYRSDTSRARDTAAPLAAALGLTPIVYPANDIMSLVNQIFADHSGSTVVVVGHSNTVPQIIAAAGGPSLANIDELEFDNLFILTNCRCRHRPATLVNLQYGANSP